MTFPESFAIITDEVSQELPVLRAFVREFRLPGIELRSFAGRAFKDLTREDIAAVAAAAREDGWKIFGCATPVFKCGLDEAATIRDHREIFRRSIDVAHTLNCDLLRVFTFLRVPDPLGGGRLARVTEHLLDLVELAKGSGLRLGIENEHSCLVATVAEMETLLAQLPDSVGAIWDPCNVIYVPGVGMPEPGDFARLGARLFHVHAKDAVRRTSTHGATRTGPLPAIAMPIGAGEVDWRAHLQALAASGYRGAVSLETHWRLQNLDESLLHLPAGHAFSHGGEAASRTCLHTLKAITESL